MTVGDFVAMLGTYSGVITASPQERETALARVRTALQERFPGAGEIDVPMRSLCWRADRLARTGWRVPQPGLAGQPAPSPGQARPGRPSLALVSATSMPCRRSRFSPRILRLAWSVSCG